MARPPVPGSSDRPPGALRNLAARGTLVNGVFLASLSLLNLVRSFILAHELTRKDYGIWGVILISLGTLLWLKQAGVGDKYVQQDDTDQEDAFQRAFTLEAMFMGLFMGLLAVAIPVMALVYGRSDLIAPACVLLAVFPAIALAASVSQFSDRVDQIVTGTIYPAICAVADRTALLHESFVKSNRLGLMWAVPFGLGITLFAGDLVHFGIGDRWTPAIVLLQWFGVTAALNHLGFNWDAYFRARGDTRPIAVMSVAAIVVFLGVAIPLTLTDGLRGLAIGLAIQAATLVAVRGFFLRRLFAGFTLRRHALRAIA